MTRKGVHIARHMLPEVSLHESEPKQFPLPPPGWTHWRLMCGCQITHWPREPLRVEKCEKHGDRTYRIRKQR